MGKLLSKIKSKLDPRLRGDDRVFTRFLVLFPRFLVSFPRRRESSLKKYSCLFLCILTSPATFAFLPVIDPTSISREVAMIEQLKQQLGRLESLNQTAENQYKSITGMTHFGDNVKQQIQAMKWAPSSWQDALKGNSGSSTFSHLSQQYLSQYRVQDATNYIHGASANRQRIYTHQLQTNRATVAASTLTFNQVNQHLANIQKYGADIGGGSDTNLKQAVDLNSRIQLEQAAISAAQLRMMAVQNQQLSAEQTARIQSESDASQFNQGGISS